MPRCFLAAKLKYPYVQWKEEQGVDQRADDDKIGEKEMGINRIQTKSNCTEEQEEDERIEHRMDINGNSSKAESKGRRKNDIVAFEDEEIEDNDSCIDQGKRIKEEAGHFENDGKRSIFGSNNKLGEEEEEEDDNEEDDGMQGDESNFENRDETRETNSEMFFHQDSREGRDGVMKRDKLEEEEKGGTPA